ncbi:MULTISPECIES: small basic family protein [Bacillus]|uniref:small basic family protein n=1 Tax=Bacillus TaxID=1386 RepID=UPI0004128093|nr:MULTISPECIES: small basic family protein [Bacillus]QHZ46711.1 small basic family protein [Bacillus sp. NSP9.1]WFA06842.1 small basic family protein [Bacillus sp. HSf4]
MWLPVLGLLLGIAIGFGSNFTIPEEYSNYLSLAILASLDTLVGGIRAHLESAYDELVFVTGFFFNIILAIGLAFLGVHLGVDLYLVGMFAFGVRLFQNIAVIRRILLAKWTASRRKK